MTAIPEVHVDPLIRKIQELLRQEQEVVIFEECERAREEVARRLKEKVPVIVAGITRDIRMERLEERIVITIELKDQSGGGG